MKLSERAKSDPRQRSVLFESWLTSQENWGSSKLLMRLRSSSKSQHTGVRRWYFRREMVQKWGEEITAAMIEDKLQDDERKNSEIRGHPDMKPREDPLHVQQCVHIQSMQPALIDTHLP